MSPNVNGVPKPTRNNFTAWVLRASLVGFTAGCKLLLQDVPHFGDLVKVRANGTLNLFGLIYDVTVQDDLMVRQLILADVLEPELVLDQRENRLAPIELSVLTVGCLINGQINQGLPPQPPISLDSLAICDETELRAFTSDLAYLRLILNAPRIPTDELLVVNLNRAAAVRPPEARYPFLVEAGRELACFLGYDLVRLNALLKRIKPV